MSFVICIAGGSCSGKTTLARHLQHRLGADSCMAIRQDDYYFDIRERETNSELPNFDVPEALDFKKMAEDIAALKNGEPVALPNYDFVTHQRRLPSEPLEPRKYIIVEGLLLLNAEEVRPLFDHSLYMKCSYEERFARRLARDVAERGRTEDFVHKQFHEDVEPAHQSFVAPSAKYADEVIHQSEYVNDLTGLIDRVVELLPKDELEQPTPQMRLAL
ncbi:uridine kinase [Litorimonas taeanensis]|uniref:Uridine kinase n=1 Tax=Litorimonas taeanensis TaxID=568099 RepID=A0A420WJD9_9PROT|nr:uridine kinase [Litorimonas taeanensis]RKQ71133.1 uridine kinase [Litorimonas taeanensis]